jgi:hypothetical protein
MSLRVTLSVDSLENLDRIAGSIEQRIEMNTRIAADAEIFVKARGKETAAKEHRTANRLGAVPTGHLSDAYEGIDGRAGAEKAELLIQGASRLRAAFGTYVLTPKNAKFLTIPMHRDAYGKRARELDDLFVISRPGKALMLARRTEAGPSPTQRFLTRQRPTVRRRERNPDQGIEVMYVLVKTATIPVDEGLIPFDALAEEAWDSAQAYLDEVIGEAMGGNA